MRVAADRATEELATRLEACFPDRSRSPRWVGREAEFPLVTRDGRAGDAELMWPVLLEQAECEAVRDVLPGGAPEAVIGVRGREWECLMEVGRCTVEVITGPRPSLPELARDHDRALSTVVAAAREVGLRLLGCGIQPRTPARAALLSPKRRYRYLVKATDGRWETWCITASDQTHLDAGRDELFPLTNVLNALSGAVIALTANSSVYGGRRGRYASGREGLMASVTGEPYRHGAVPRPFADGEDYVRFVLGFRCLFLPDGRGGYRLGGGPLADVGGEEGFQRFLFHDHYWWPSARPRARLGTIEVRPACQQPADSSWAPAALALGLAEAADGAAEIVEEHGWTSLLEYRARSVVRGMSALEPGTGFLRDVLEVAASGLGSRGFGEERLLEPLWKRLERGTGPADEARAVVRDRGVPGLLRLRALE
jgi:glutamate--cysteine ligase